MSKTINADLECSRCGAEFSAVLYQTIWVEDPDLRAEIFEDRVNVATCTRCGASSRVPMSFMATNSPSHFAVWYEPIPDEDIEIHRQGYEAMFGPGNYFSEAPRISDWQEFKETIEKFERGELVGQPPTKASMDDMMQAMFASRPPAEKRPGFLSRLFGRK